MMAHSSNSASPSPNVLDALQQWHDGLAEYRLASPDHLGALERALSDARRGRLDQPPPPTLTILLLGASGAGKSQLLNALAGETIAASHHVRPTTRRPTIYAHASVPPERLFDYGPVLGELARKPGAFVTHNREELRHKILIDAPDIDSYETAHRQIVLDLMPAVDVALYVVTAYNYKDDIGWQTVLAERGRRAFAFVMNKWDPEGKPRVAPGSPDVDEDLRALLVRGGWDNPLIFRTSARYWLARKTGEAEGQGPPPEGDQFPELERWLSAGLSTSQIEQIQRRRRRSLWGALAAAASSALPPDLSESPWPALAQAELSALCEEAWLLMTPPLHARARALALLRDQARRPASPGPFGLMQRLASGVASGAKGLGKVRAAASLPAAGAAALSGPAAAGAGAPAGAPASADMPPADLSAAVATSIGQFVERRLSGLEWRAREAHFPVDWIDARWRALIPHVQPELANAADAAAADLAARATGKARRVAGLTATALAEIVVTGVLIIAVWRLGEAFVLGRYLDLGFLLNLLALLVCIFLLGQFLIALLLPSSDAAFRREMEARVERVWRKIAKRFEGELAAFLKAAGDLRRQGLDLVQRCGAETQRLTSEIIAASHGAADQADQLFGQEDEESLPGRMRGHGG